ncbi:hypothetical protein ACB092_12G020600 [Castanea dentata]
MASLVGGAALAAVFGEVFNVLHDTVKCVGSDALMYKPILKSLQFNLNLLAPVVEEIRQLNKKLDHPEGETKSLKEDMRKARELMGNLGPQEWDYPLQAYYGRQLTELNEAIVMFFQLSCSVTGPSDFTVGMDEPLKVLKTKLLEEKKQQLLLTAPGGCGKTILVKMLGHDQESKGKFKDNIFFVPVSKTLNPMVIVQRLFHSICDREPEFQSDEDAINQLQVLLTQMGSSPILLILDDVCPGSEFHLEKFKFDITKYNILVTSRTTLPQFSFTYNLKPLNDEDAMTLLCHSASVQDGSSHIPDEVIKKAVGGFPLALEVNGKSLYGKPVEAWRSRARKWSNGHSIFSSSSDLLHCLWKSLEFSDDKDILKECFMDLGSFSESQRIDVPSLIDIWEVLHELDEDGNDAIAYLHELATRNLATLVMTSYNEDFVTQHNLLRELAMYESSQEPIGQRKRLIMDINKNTLSKWCTKEDQHLINARLLSISTDELFLSSWCNIQAPKVEVLILNFQTRNYCLPDFMFKMDKLKVLMINNYRYFPAELRNFQLLKSLPNLKTNKLEKVSIPSLCKAPVLLKSLKKISLFMCKIVSDALPNLMEINIDYCNDLVELPAVLCDVICLKKLSITNCHQLSALPNGIGKLVNLELLESKRSFHKLCILDISDCLGIRHLPKDIGELCNLKELYMKGCLSLRKGLPPSTTNLEQLKLVICDEERAKFWEPIKEVLTNLEVKVAEKIST